MARCGVNRLNQRIAYQRGLSMRCSFYDTRAMRRPQQVGRAESKVPTLFRSNNALRESGQPKIENRWTKRRKTENWSRVVSSSRKRPRPRSQSSAPPCSHPCPSRPWLTKARRKVVVIGVALMVAAEGVEALVLTTVREVVVEVVVAHAPIVVKTLVKVAVRGDVVMGAQA